MPRARGRPRKVPVPTPNGVGSENVSAPNDDRGSNVDTGPKSADASGPELVAATALAGGSTGAVGQPANPAEFGQPADATGTGTGADKPRRGRPPGSGATKKQVPLDISGLEKILLTASLGIAFATGAEEMKLDNQEANSLASSVKDLLEYYPVKWLDAKTAAWINLLQTTAYIVGPRMFAMRARRMMTAKNIPLRSAPAQKPIHAEKPPQQGPMMTPSGINGATQPAMPTREVPPEATIGEIPGVGAVQFPDDHPLGGGRKPN